MLILNLMESKEAITACSSNHLPEDIIEEILKRLPVTCLLRLKSICKSWYSLIQSQSFISNHLQHHTNQDKHSIIGAISLDRDDIEFAISLLCSETTLIHDMPYPDIPFRMDEDLRRDVVGSSDGLVCVNLSRKHNKIIVWNPAIRQYRFLPPPSILIEPTDVCLGFGKPCHSVIQHEYKLVRLVQVLDADSNNVDIKSEIFTWSTDSWKEINATIPPYYCAGSDSVVLKGVLYKLVKEIDPENVSLLSFDLEREVFWRTEVPSHCKCLSDVRCLMVYKDSPALVLRTEDMRYCSLWAMKEEGNWEKMFTLGMTFNFMTKVLGVWRGIQIIVNEVKDDAFSNRSYGNCIRLYDLSTHKLHDLIPKGKDEIFLESWGYVASLVPPCKAQRALCY